MIKTKFNENLSNLLNNMKDIKSELGHLIDLNNVNKMFLNKETADRLSICISSLKEHVSNLTSIKESYESELNSYKSEKLSLLTRKGINRTDYIKAKSELSKYDDGKELTLVEKMTCKDTNYINYKSLLKVYNLFLKEFNSNIKLLNKYQKVYINCVENYNKTYSKIDTDLKENLLSTSSLEESVNVISQEKGDISLLSKFDSLGYLDKKEVCFGFVNTLKDEFKMSLDVKKLLKVDDCYPKVIKDLLYKINEMLTTNEKSGNIQLIKEKLILDVTLDEFKIRKVLKDGVSQLKIMKFDNDLIPLYSSDSNSWLNENERKEFYVKALDFIES